MTLPSGSPYPVTPDGRYFVVRGRLWRMADPSLNEMQRSALVKELMDARRALRGTPTPEAKAAARQAVQRAKVALGERGPVWWGDGTPDENRKLVRNTSYAAWADDTGATDTEPSAAGRSARAK
ncbi:MULTISPECIES: hypothetical protein [unclassified Acidovorax]|uniref:hypothetical protein n=1 Tax=unclassified Acidovorax TaxID=2684926 RepID=UPI002882F18B|nr:MULTISPECIES: hypothetical protein [unclassified Acidovorax]